MNENEITNAYFTELYSRNAAQKEKALENSRALHAADRNRTGTGITTHGILSHLVPTDFPRMNWY